MTHVLFAGHNYYPKGGIDDIVARGTVDELKVYFQAHAKDIANYSYVDNWGQIVDAATLECVLWGECESTPDLEGAQEAVWFTTPPDER